LLGLLQGRAVLALTDTAATIKTPSGGTVHIPQARQACGFCRCRDDVLLVRTLAAS
jgi:coproporphyrinogen III oxidase-like Fe-S oxidoreductase